MASATDRILREVMAPPVEDRADLFRRLEEALSRESGGVADEPSEPVIPDEVRAAWVQVALERLDRHARGGGATKSIDEVEHILADSLRER